MDARSDFLRDIFRRAEQPLGPGHVKERFIDADRLDQRREGFENREHPTAQFAIPVEARPRDDRMRAKPARDGHRFAPIGSRTPAPRSSPRSPRPAGRHGRRARACRAFPDDPIVRPRAKNASRSTCKNGTDHGANCSPIGAVIRISCRADAHRPAQRHARPDSIPPGRRSNCCATTAPNILLHAGDVCGESVIDTLTGGPAGLVWGNNDVDRRPLAAYCKTIGVTCFDVLGEIELDAESEFAITHGDDLDAGEANSSRSKVTIT